MKTIFLAATLSTAAFGQGYAGYAPGFFGTEAAAHGAMVGGDFVFSKGLGLNVDLTGMGFREGSGFGIFSPALTYHYNPGRRQRVVPFAETGPGLGFAIGGADARIWQVGAGAIFWIKPRLGIRAEVRHHRHVLYNDFGITQVRVGLAWK